MKTLIERTVHGLAVFLILYGCSTSDGDDDDDGANGAGFGGAAPGTAGRGGGMPSGKGGTASTSAGVAGTGAVASVTPTAVRIAVGATYVLGVRSDGSLLAWGSNVRGDGAVLPGTGGVRVLSGFEGIAAIHASLQSDVAITSSGIVLARGYATTNGEVPTTLGYLGRAKAVVPRNEGILVHLADGSVAFSVYSSRSIEAIPRLGSVVSLAQSVALKSDGTAWQIDISQNRASAIQVVDVPPLVWAGWGHGIDEDGDLWTWPEATLSGVHQDWTSDVKFVSGEFVLKNDGTVWVQAGDSERQLPGFEHIVEIHSGSTLGLAALRDDGTVWVQASTTDEEGIQVAGVQLWEGADPGGGAAADDDEAGAAGAGR